MVALDPREIDGDGDTALLLEGRQVNDRERVLVVRHHITARVGHIDLALDNLQFVGLETHDARIHNLHGNGINLGNITTLLIVRVDLNRACITRHIGIATVETDETAVGNVELVFFLTGVLVEHIHLVGAVDDTVQVTAIDADIVAHIAHLLGHRGIGIGEDVADVLSLSVIIVVERGLVPAHITLTQQVEALYISKFRLCYRHMLGQKNRHLLATPRQQYQHKQQLGKKNRPFVPFYILDLFHQMSNLRMSL